MFFASAYFDHDAFMHHAIHVLDATEKKNNNNLIIHKNSTITYTHSIPQQLS